MDEGVKKALKKKTVTIVGYETMSRDGADLKGVHGEVWGLNKLYRIVSARWTRWFEIHAGDYLRRDGTHWGSLSQMGIPIYMQREHEDIPTSKTFPRERLNAYLKRRFRTEPDYFTSSFSYMFGLAMLEGFTEIHLYGVTMTDEYETYFERAGLEYLIGLARGSGVRVNVSPKSPLLHIGYVYGYQEPRLTLDQVGPAIAYLDDAIAWQEAEISRAEAEKAKMPRRLSDEQQKRWEQQLLVADGNIRGMRNARTWLRFYGKGGSLLRPDGRVN